MSDIATAIDQQPISSDAKIKWNVRSNPKREGSKAHARFSKYMNSKTVGEYLEKDGTKGDLKYDAAKGFIEILSQPAS